MDRIRFFLVGIGISCIITGAVLLYAAVGIGRWFALGAIVGGAFVLGGITFSTVVDRRLARQETAALGGAGDHDGLLAAPPATRGR